MNTQYRMLINWLWVSAFILVLSPAVSAEAVSMDEAHEMEKHWDAVIHEKDPGKQKALINEHRERMSEYSSRKDLRNIHRTSSEESMERNMDLINTIDMHKKIMWMLEGMH